MTRLGMFRRMSHVFACLGVRRDGGADPTDRLQDKSRGVRRSVEGKCAQINSWRSVHFHRNVSIAQAIESSALRACGDLHHGGDDDSMFASGAFVLAALHEPDVYCQALAAAERAGGPAPSAGAGVALLSTRGPASLAAMRRLTDRSRGAVSRRVSYGIEWGGRRLAHLAISARRDPG